MPLHRSASQILLTFRFCNHARSRQKQWKLSVHRRPLAAVSVGVWAWHTSYTHRPTRDDGCNIFCGTDGNGSACGPKGMFKSIAIGPTKYVTPEVTIRWTALRHGPSHAAARETTTKVVIQSQSVPLNMLHMLAGKLKASKMVHATMHGMTPLAIGPTKYVIPLLLAGSSGASVAHHTRPRATTQTAIKRNTTARSPTMLMLCAMSARTHSLKRNPRRQG
jgi:hypothetical protein